MTLQQSIQEQEQIIAKAQYELTYLKAYEFLTNLEATAEVKLVDYLVPYYGVETKKIFEHKEFTDFVYSTSKRVKAVKYGISRYKSQADTKKNPEWAKEALKAATIVDEYFNNRKEF